MDKSPARKRKTRLPLILAGLFFVAWAVAVVFAAGETFSRPHEKKEALTAASPGGPGGAGGRYPILDRQRQELAVSFPMKSVYARPLEIDNPGEAAGFLARELHLDETRLQRDFREERGFFWLGRQIPEAVVGRIRQRNLSGIYVVDESQRYYPRGELAAHVVGFVGEGHGLAGVEAQYDRLLRGLAEPLEQDSADQGGGPLVLTIDLRAQDILARQLAELVQESSATGGCALLLEADSGAILALTSQPGYDPNFFWDYDENGRTNRASGVNLPGSGFLDLFRLAALYQNGPPVETGKEAVAPQLSALKTELKLARVLEKNSGPGARLVRQGERFLSPALAGLEEIEDARDFGPFLEELGLGRQSIAGVGTGLEPDNEAGSFRLTGVELLGGLATLLNSKGAVMPHLLAGVLDSASGQLQPGPRPVQPMVLRPDVVARIQGYFRGLPQATGGVVVLEELTPVAGPDEPEPIAPGPKEGTPPQRYANLLVSLAGGENSPPLLLLLALEQALIDPAVPTPMRLAAEKLLAPGRKWAASSAKVVATWHPRENKWRSEWQNLQSARAGKSREVAVVDRRQMPNLQGLSLRKALQVLNSYGLRVQVQGAGRVTGQQPAAGAVINGEQCTLVLAGLEKR